MSWIIGASGGAAGAALGQRLRIAALGHRTGDPRPPMRRVTVRVLGVLVLGVNLVLGLALLTAALADTLDWQLRLALPLAGLFWLSTLPLIGRRFSLRPLTRNQVRTTTAQGQPATVVDLDRRPLVTALWMTGGLTVFALWATVHWVASGALGAALVFGVPCLLLFGVPAGTMLAGVRRDGFVALTPEGIHVRSWFSETSLAWDDAARVDVQSSQRGPSLRVSSGSRPAPSWQGRRRPHLWPMRDPLREGTVLISVETVEPHAESLFTLLQRLVDDPTERHRLGTAAAAQQLTPPALQAQHGS